MEELDRARARAALRANPQEVLRPVVVTTVDDIRRLVATLDPQQNRSLAELPLQTLVQVDENDRQVTYKVEASTRSRSKRELLMEGLAVVRTRLDAQSAITRGAPVEVNGSSMQPASLGDGVDSLNWVDALIKRWLGGYRDGFYICWQLSDGYTYRYNIFEHRLTRCEHAHAGT